MCLCLILSLPMCVPLMPFSLQPKTGLPISTYFSAVKLRWLLDNVGEVRQAVQSGRAMFGTVDSWVIWVGGAQMWEGCFCCPAPRGSKSDLLFPQCLTGGSRGGVHCTDVTNASRTMLFNIHTMDWDSELCRSATLVWTLSVPSASPWSVDYLNNTIATDHC